MGAGDIKLMAGFGSLLGPGTILRAAWIAAIAGGIMAVLTVALRALCRNSRTSVKQQDLDAIPYAPAIVIGAWLAEMARGS